MVAHRCGYGDDLLTYAREHDFAHAYLCERLYRQPSPVLWALAHGLRVRAADRVEEELAVIAFQRWLRASERPIVAGADWDTWKADALALLDGPDSPPAAGTREPWPWSGKEPGSTARCPAMAAAG